jgi:hypothetical protein
LGFATGRSFTTHNQVLWHHHHRAINKFSSAIAGEEEDFCKGSFHTHILYFVLSFALLYFYLHHFIKNPKN